MKRRRAASLIELLSIMSACTVVLTLTGVLLQRAMVVQMRSRGQVDAERAALRLSGQLRRDVHEARNLETGDPGSGKHVFLRLDFADGRVGEYSALNGTVLRLILEKVGRSWREAYAFPVGSDVAIREDSPSRRLTLTITNKPGDHSSADNKGPVPAFAIPVSFQVEAIPGRDLRFAAASAGQEAPK